MTGKGRKERVVPFSSGVRQALSSYVAKRGILPRQDRLFVTHFGEAMTRFCVRDMLRRRAETAGLEGVRVNSHVFRHSFAKMYLLNGGDVFSLQRILGHASLEMVRNYMNLVQGEVHRQHSRFSPVDHILGDQITGQRKRLK